MKDKIIELLNKDELTSKEIFELFSNKLEEINRNLFECNYIAQINF